MHEVEIQSYCLFDSRSHGMQDDAVVFSQDLVGVLYVNYQWSIAADVNLVESRFLVRDR